MTLRPRGRPRLARACTHRHTRITDVRPDEHPTRREDHSTRRQRRRHAADTTRQKARPPSIIVRGNPRRAIDLDLLTQALVLISPNLHQEKRLGQKGTAS